MEKHSELLQIAATETGLTNFGPDSFREGLEILVNALRNEANLNATGEHVLRERILTHLKQRLQIEDWYQRHPEIEDVQLEKPLIGISLPRTGSTALSFLLAQDPNAHSLRQWEASEPCPPPSTIKGEDPRKEKVDPASQTPGFKSNVPTGKNAPAECQDLMSLDFKSQMFDAFARIPSYSKWLFDADLTSTYLYERRVLKLLEWGFPARPWRLKAPTHLLYLADLDRAFPDARFVMTHRDPADVMLSVINVYIDIAGLFTDELDYSYMTELNVHNWSKGMERALAFRDAGNEDRFYDIQFRAMHADPIAEVRGLYAWLNEPVTEEFETGMRDWWQENSENREPPNRRDPQTIGLKLDEIRPLFADYTRRMGPG